MNILVSTTFIKTTNIFPFCVITCGTVLGNGVLNKIFGEITSEGICLAITLSYLVTHVKWRLDQLGVLGILAILFLLLLNLIEIVFLEQWTRILFFYPYFFYILFLCINFKNNHLDVSCLVKALVIFACFSSAFAIAQRFGMNTLLPLESELRATGLSRSSLNLTGCLVIVFGLGILVIKDTYIKLISLLLIFIGIMAAGGRGGIISAMIFLFIKYYKNFTNIKFALILIILCILNFFLFHEWFFRAFSALNFISDQSNLDRLGSYYDFFDRFLFFGGGIGSTSSAALRFHYAIGFESSLLNLIYEIGIIFSIIFLIIFILFLCRLSPYSRKLIFIFIFALLPMLLGQQLFGIPSAFCALFLGLFSLANYKIPLRLL